MPFKFGVGDPRMYVNPLWRTPRNPRINEEVGTRDLLVTSMPGKFGRARRVGYFSGSLNCPGGDRMIITRWDDSFGLLALLIFLHTR